MTDAVKALSGKSIESGRFLGDGIWPKSQIFKEFKSTPAYNNYNSNLHAMLDNALTDEDFEELKKAKLANDDLLLQFEVQKAIPLQKSLAIEKVQATIQLIYASRGKLAQLTEDAVKEYFEVDLKDGRVTCRSKKQIQLR